MTTSMLQSTIKQLRNDIAQLDKDIGATYSKEADTLSKKSQIEQSITRTTSLSSLSQKQRDIRQLIDALGQIQKKRSDLEKKKAEKTSKLHKAENDLFIERSKEQKKQQETDKRNHQEQIRQQDELKRHIHENQVLSASLISRPPLLITAISRDYDVFISHASEDKDDLVRPLAEKLKEAGLRVWYDEFELKVGDSLRRSIDKGLANSRYGIVVISRAFFAKDWPQRELDGLWQREVNGTKVILPIWHNITKDEVISKSPMLSDKLALNSAILTLDEMTNKLLEEIQSPDTVNYQEVD